MAGVESGKICVFGAGGPVGAAAANSLRRHYTLRLTDLRAIEDIVDPQSKNAPMPAAPEPPHEWRQLDITDYEQVVGRRQGDGRVDQCVRAAR